METTLDPETETRIRDQVRFHSTQGPEAVERRLEELEREIDLERAVVVGLSGIGAFGLLAGFFGSRMLRLLTWASVPLILMHALGRWAPPAPLRKSLGFRSRRAIEEERYALKALRGDFKGVEPADPEAAETADRQAVSALDAVKK
jgi:hypothetical protein